MVAQWDIIRAEAFRGVWRQEVSRYTDRRRSHSRTLNSRPGFIPSFRFPSRGSAVATFVIFPSSTLLLFLPARAEERQRRGEGRKNERARIFVPCCCWPFDASPFHGGDFNGKPRVVRRRRLELLLRALGQHYGSNKYAAPVEFSERIKTRGRPSAHTQS